MHVSVVHSGLHLVNTLLHLLQLHHVDGVQGDDGGGHLPPLHHIRVLVPAPAPQHSQAAGLLDQHHLLQVNILQWSPRHHRRSLHLYPRLNSKY